MSANNDPDVNQIAEISSNDNIDQPEIIEISDSEELIEPIVISDSEDIPEIIVLSDSDDLPEPIEISDSPEPSEVDLPKCAVCWELFSKFGVIWKTGCGHTFCRTCLLRVFEDERPCPLCREPLNIAKQQINTNITTSTYKR